MNDLTCLGCGKRFKNVDKYEAHAKRCNKLANLLPLLYNVPTVKIQDLAHLEARQLPNNNDWGIWNANAGDWLRDEAGQIDSRVFKHNIRELLSHVIAVSVAARKPVPPS